MLGWRGHGRITAVCSAFLAICSVAWAQGITELHPSGIYIQTASGMTFPEVVHGFNRIHVLRYRDDGSDESASYNFLEPGRGIVATVYVFPSPPITSIGSPPEAIADARERLCTSLFTAVRGEIRSAYRAQEIGSEETSFLQSGETFTARKASFTFSIGGFFRRSNVKSDVYLLCYVGDKWAVQYRFTYPEELDAGGTIAEFMRDLALTIRSSAQP